MIRPGNALLDAFIAGPDRAVQKWIDYFDAYDRLLSPWRGRALTFLEIGVQNGGSLMMWRDYLGPEARIIGVDVDPNCRAMTEHGFEIWIGDQGDPAFWEQFKAAVPAIDVVLDDGGHTMRQQLVTFDALFPIVSNGGLFIVEDTHTSYFPSHGGGAPGHPGTWMGKVKDLIDQMHAWYHAPIDKADQVMAAVTIPSTPSSTAWSPSRSGAALHPSPWLSATAATRRTRPPWTTSPCVAPSGCPTRASDPYVQK
ncbi:MAG: class I SAM-dependent methyltransferase [Brevundimonas sp.]|nr:class I SAM-dependent methyltransferase [Brevundimonas sp.]